MEELWRLLQEPGSSESLILDSPHFRASRPRSFGSGFPGPRPPSPGPSPHGPFLVELVLPRVARCPGPWPRVPLPQRHGAIAVAVASTRRPPGLDLQHPLSHPQPPPLETVAPTHTHRKGSGKRGTHPQGSRKIIQEFL